MLFSHECQWRFLECGFGPEGLGDELERYLYCHWIARVLRIKHVLAAELARPKNHSHHHSGADQHGSVTALLGITNHSQEDVLRRFPGIQTHYFTRDTALAFRRENRDLPCPALASSHIITCNATTFPFRWCDAGPPEVGSVFQWLSKPVNSEVDQVAVKRRCNQLGLGIPRMGEVLNVVWHVRAGDICLHCEAGAPSHKRILASLRSAIGTRPFKISFESERPPTFIMAEPEFADADFLVNSSLLATVCRFVTADVLITSGSSFPIMVSAFSPPPIIIEEQRKEVEIWRHRSPSYNVSTHFLSAGPRAILMINGTVVSHTPQQLVSIFAAL
jgi:hypothetical protein